MSIDGRSERDRDSLASYTDFIFLFTVFRVHLPGRNRFDFLLFGKLFFLAASSFFLSLLLGSLFRSTEVVTVVPQPLCHSLSFHCLFFMCASCFCSFIKFAFIVFA